MKRLVAEGFGVGLGDGDGVGVGVGVGVRTGVGVGVALGVGVGVGVIAPVKVALEPQPVSSARNMPAQSGLSRSPTHVRPIFLHITDARSGQTELCDALGGGDVGTGHDPTTVGEGVTFSPPFQSFERICPEVNAKKLLLQSPLCPVS